MTTSPVTSPRQLFALMQPFAQRLVVGGQAVLRAYKPKITYSKPKDTKKQFHDTLIVRSPNFPSTFTQASPTSHLATKRFLFAPGITRHRSFGLERCLWQDQDQDQEQRDAGVLPGLRPCRMSGKRPSRQRRGRGGGRTWFWLDVLPPWSRLALQPCVCHVPDP